MSLPSCLISTDADNQIVSGGDGKLLVQLPGDISATTINQSLPNHTHNIVSSSSALPNTLLSTDGLGNIILNDVQAGELELSGGLTADGIVAFAQDFTAANTLYVNDSASNVGIGCPPDPQFVLDVCGNVRFQGIVVDDRFQVVDDVSFLAHYDSPTAVLSNFVGSLDSIQGQIAQQNVSIHLPGVYGKGYAIYGDSQFTNWVQNAALTGSYTDATGAYWSDYDPANPASVNSTVNTNFIKIGSNAMHVASDGTAAKGVTVGIAAGIPTGQYVARVRVYLVSGTLTIEHGATSTVISSPGWNDVKGLMDEAGSINIYFGNGVPGDVYIDYASMTPDVAVSSLTTHPELVADMFGTPISNEVVLPIEYIGGADYTTYELKATGTITMWWKPSNDYMDQPYGVLLASNNMRIEWNTGTKTIDVVVDGVVLMSSLTLTFAAEDNIYIAVTWDAAGAEMYVNPASSAPDSTALAMDVVPSDGELHVGYDGTTNRIIGLIDDVMCLDRRIEGTQIYNIYTSGVPVFANSSTWAWRTPTGLAWIDDEGLWAFDDTGAAAFGVSGVDSKVWGGYVLDRGDLLIGNNDQSVFWDASTGVLSVGGDIQIGDGTITAAKLNVSELSAITADMGVLNAGRIVLGSGNIGVDFTGVVIDADGLVYDAETWNFVGLNNDVLQLGIRALDGSMIAGAGDVRIDRDGITLEAYNTWNAGDRNEITWYNSASGGRAGGLIGEYSDSGDAYVYMFSNIGSTLDGVVRVRTDNSGYSSVNMEARDVVSATANDIYLLGKLGLYNGEIDIWYGGGVPWELGGTISVDATWMRLNQNTAQNIYTPRMFRADNGITSGAYTPTSGQIAYTQLRPLNAYNAYAFVPAIIAVGFSSNFAGTYNIVLSDLGIPATAKAVSINILCAFQNDLDQLILNTWTGTSFFPVDRAQMSRGGQEISVGGIVIPDSNGYVQYSISGNINSGSYRIMGYFI